MMRLWKPRSRFGIAESEPFVIDAEESYGLVGAL
jgi:hypothetical protein